MPGLRILVAPDTFTGTLSASDAARIVAEVVASRLPAAEVETVPIADGGDGLLEVAVAAGGVVSGHAVAGPLGAPVDAAAATLGPVAVIELAAASGLRHVAQPGPISALRADTRGVGELIRAALDDGATELVIGVGGSASTDGGRGALDALGLRVLDAAGAVLPPGGGALVDAAALDVGGLDPRLTRARIRIATDVSNPLIGPDGAAAVYASQKGAGPEEVARLERGLAAWAALLQQATGVDVRAVPGSGAAGGFASGFVALTGASIESGFELVARMLDLPARIARADLVIVGEGSLDAQTLAGKAPLALAGLASAAGVDVVAVAGRIRLPAEQLRDAGVTAWSALEEHAPDVDAAMREAPRWLAVATEAALDRWLAARAAR